jgi:hypothetical protein
MRLLSPVYQIGIIVDHVRREQQRELNEAQRAAERSQARADQLGSQQLPRTKAEFQVSGVVWCGGLLY